MWVISEGKSRPCLGGVSFYSSGKFHRLMSWRSIAVIWGKGLWFPGIGPLPTFWPCGHGARGVSPSLLLYSSECVPRLQVEWRSTHPPLCAYLGLASLCHVWALPFLQRLSPAPSCLIITVQSCEYSLSKLCFDLCNLQTSWSLHLKEPGK